MHLGHQALIRQVVREAREMGAQSALMTFQPHPQSVLRDDPPPMLTSLPLRLRLFEALGLDAAYVIPFTRELAALEPAAFVRQYLLSYFQVRKLLIGFDFHFGRNREGSAAVLRALSVEHGFAFEVFPEVEVDGHKVSSSRIRSALAAAEFAEAERFLGRPFSVLEPVRKGQQRGRSLGFPTLNQIPAEPLPLPFGVYAVRAVVRGRTHDGVSNYGLRPTVGAERPVLETHLFDFAAEVFPLCHLRAEQRFPSLEALQAQITADRDAAQAYLKQAACAGGS